MRLQKTKWLLLVITLSGWLFITAVGAEVYQYKDAAGVTRFTNDLTKVPADQRSDVTSYTELTSREQNVYDGSENPEENFGEDEGASGAETGESDNLNRFKDLNQQKARLDEEYKELVKEKEELLNIKQEAGTPEEKQAVNEKIRDLNERISQYDVRRKAFSEEAEAFNQGIDQPVSADEKQN